MGWLNNPGILNGLASGISGGVAAYGDQQKQQMDEAQNLQEMQQRQIELSIRQRLADLQAKQVEGADLKNQADLRDSGFSVNNGQVVDDPNYLLPGPDGKPLSRPMSAAKYKAMGTGNYEKNQQEADLRKTILSQLFGEQGQPAPQAPAGPSPQAISSGQKLGIPASMVGNIQSVPGPANQVNAGAVQRGQSPLSYANLSADQKAAMGLDPFTDKMLGNLREDATFDLSKKKEDREAQAQGQTIDLARSRFNKSNDDTLKNRKKALLDEATKSFADQKKDHEKVAEVADKIIELAKTNTPGSFGSIKQLAVGLTKERPSVIAARNIYDGVSAYDSIGNSINQMMGGGLSPEMQKRIIDIAKQNKDLSLKNIDNAKNQVIGTTRGKSRVLGAGLSDKDIADSLNSRVTQPDGGDDAAIAWANKNINSNEKNNKGVPFSTIAKDILKRSGVK